MNEWNIRSKRFIFACIPAMILLATGIRSVILWDFGSFVQIFPYCGGYLAVYSGYESKWPTGATQ